MAKMSPTSEAMFSILLPTYNERENLPIIVWLIIKYMRERYHYNYIATRPLILRQKYFVICNDVILCLRTQRPQV